MTRITINADKLGNLELMTPLPEELTYGRKAFDVSLVLEIWEKLERDGYDVVLRGKAKKLMIESDFPTSKVRRINNVYYRYENETQLRPNLIESNMGNGSVKIISDSELQELLIGEPTEENGITTYEILKI
ncbi:MAG: hypothetical protein ACI9QC_000538 [Oceanicoccus sp.]|jgi:hypothetical protein